MQLLAPRRSWVILCVALGFSLVSLGGACLYLFLGVTFDRIGYIEKSTWSSQRLDLWRPLLTWESFVETLKPSSAISSSATMPGNTMETQKSPGRMPAMTTFLKEAKDLAHAHIINSSSHVSQLHRTDNTGPIVLVMGNGAGDLDSLASAVGLSYFLTYLPRDGLPLTSPLPSQARYVPLIQIAREDVLLRPENQLALDACGISVNDLLFISDLSDPGNSDGIPRLAVPTLLGSNLALQNRTLLGLVDHPALELSWKSLGSGVENAVTLVVDHHADEGAHRDAALRVFRGPVATSPSNTNNPPTPPPVGSAASIVVDLFKEHLRKAMLPRSLANLLLSAIAIDTDNLREVPNGRATLTDTEAASILLPSSSFSASEAEADLVSFALAHPAVSVNAQDIGPDISSKQIFPPRDSIARYWTLLATSKAHVRHLSSRDLLRRDYKETAHSIDSESNDVEKGVQALPSTRNPLKLGFSSVNLGLSEWLHRSNGGTEIVPPRDAADVQHVWNSWWAALLAWMNQRHLNVAVVGTSFRDEDAKHRRELVIAFTPPAHVTPQDDETIWSALRNELQHDDVGNDAHTPLQPLPSLQLQTPWKGARLASTGKRERVAGIDPNIGGRLPNAATSGNNDASTWAMVYRQTNARANRKVYMPKIVAALQKVVARVHV